MSSVPELWSEEDLEAIHRASLRLLEKAGVRVDSGGRARR
jgi:trimethylamine:corrinoid methyltransferase-like protein